MTKIKMNFEQNLLHGDNRAALQELMERGILACATELSDSNARVNFADIPTAVTADDLTGVVGTLQYLRPEFVKIMLAPMVSETIYKLEKMGSFGDENVVTQTKEFRETFGYDTDEYQGGVYANTNYGKATYGVAPLRQDWKSTDREEARGAKSRREIRSDKMAAAFDGLARHRNRVNWKGSEVTLSSSPVYGVLNHPEMPAAVPLGTGGWKTATPENIFNDIVGLMGVVAAKTQGIASAKTVSWDLQLSPEYEVILRRTNQYGLSVRGKLQSEGYAVNIHSVPELSEDSAGSETIILTASVDGKTPIVLGYTELIRVYPLFVQGSTISQKIVSDVCGATPQYPSLIAVATDENGGEGSDES